MGKNDKAKKKRDILRIGRWGFWFGLLVDWGLIAFILLDAREGNVLGDSLQWTLLGFLLVAYLILVILRLRDIGWTRTMTLFCVVAPPLALVLGFVASREGDEDASGFFW